jgi:tetratricopeptide (TPR) repeat protein
MRVCASLLAILTLLGEQTVDDVYKQGIDAFQNQRYSEAADVLLHAPGVKDALVLRAKALIHLDRYSEAEQSLQQYLTAHPESADSKFLLGYVLFRENQPSKSLAIYTAAAAQQRPLPGDFKIVGLDYVLLNDYPEAIRWFERSAKENPADAETVYYLGRAYYAQNWFDKAIAAFEQALKLNPLYAKAQNNLGLALAAQNKLDLAEHAYRRAIQIGGQGGKESEQPDINLAELLIDHDRVPEALRLLDTAKRIDPKSDRIEQLRGKALLNENRLEEAESAFRAAMALKPDSGVLHYQLGRVLKRLGRSDEAKQEFERSKALLGTHSAVPYQ